MSREVNEINARKYNDAVALMQKAAQHIKDSALMIVEEEQNMKDGVIFLMFPQGNIDLTKPLVGGMMSRHNIYDAIFLADEAKLIINTQYNPRIRLVFRDVWKDGASLPLDELREAFGLMD